MKFLVSLIPDEDGFVVAECPALPGCFSQGRTRDEALHNIKQAIHLSLLSRRELGLPLPQDIAEVEVAVQVGVLPVVSGKAAVKAFERLGWQIHRRESSHISMHKPGVALLLTIPQHKELGRGILRGLIRVAGVSIDEFIAALTK